MSLVKNLVRIQPSTTAFFLCDIQERFRSLIFQYPQVLKTAHKMVQASKILNIPLIVTEQNPKALGSTCSELDVSSASLVCPKTKFSMWIKEVDQVLSKESKPKTIVLFGIESHVCVLQTCLDLLEQDFNVVVLVDGVSSMNKGEIGIALERMKSSGAILASSESILFQLVADASNPSFKAISNLVKSTKDSTASVFESLVSQSKI